MKKLLVWGSLLGLLVAVGVAAQTAGTNTVEQNGYYFNSKTGDRVTTDGKQLIDDPLRDRDSYLAPQSIFAGTIADGAADSTDVVDLSGYRTVALLVQVASNGPNDWLRFAVNARYNLAGSTDSTSLFTLPVTASAHDDSVLAVGPPGRVSVPTVGGLGAGEFPLTVNLTTGGAATTASLPQGKVVWLTVPPGFVWPSRCSFRFRNIGREAAAVSPTVRVWVMGTPL